MKLLKLIGALTLSAPATANLVVDKLKDKTFGKFTFKGCMLVVDATMYTEYMNILNTSMKTQKSKVTIINRNEYSEHIKETPAFTMEYIYRQNYCSLVR